ncbi:MAG: alpha/beta hydrolase [Cyclobacteriaceae bacterium]|nr:alpha/beta hydrolase [Cyclobacteriaceae bacterium]
METPVHHLLNPIVAEKSPIPSRNGKLPAIVPWLRLYFGVVGRLLPKFAAGQALRLFGTPRGRYQGKGTKSIRTKSKPFTVKSDGLKIQAYLWENDGPTVLLVHGWETGGMHMSSFVEPLCALGFQVVAIDGPAHGNSQGEQTNLPHFAAAIFSVIQNLGSVNHIIAHSFGGAASVYLASQYSQQVPLDKMVLINVPNRLERIIGDFARFLRLPAKVELAMQEGIMKKFEVDPKEIQISKMGKYMEVNEILVVHDRFDDIVPLYNGLEIVHGLEQACLLECENLGHNRILKNPQVITRIGQFLKDDLKY